MFGRPIAAQEVQLGNPKAKTLARATALMFERADRRAKRCNTIGMLTDPHHVGKIMKASLFSNLKWEIKERG